jgi:hypothetical protein
MSSVRLTLAAGLAAILLTACGNVSNPLPGTGGGAEKVHGRGVIDDPRTSQTSHLKCMQQAKLPVVKVGATGLQVGPPPAGATIAFQPTAGAAQYLQISSQVQGAEVIGAALLYPNQAPANELKAIEGCLAKGVTG